MLYREGGREGGGYEGRSKRAAASARERKEGFL